MDEILKLARQLGKLIAEHPRGKAFRQAQATLTEDKSAQKLLSEYNEQVQRMQAKEAQQQPIEPEDKRKLSEAQQQLAANESIAGFVKVQADYVEIMQQVSTAMENPGVDRAQSAL